MNTRTTPIPQADTNGSEIYTDLKWPTDVPKKPLEELTEDQRKKVMNAYRFANLTTQRLDWRTMP